MKNPPPKGFSASPPKPGKSALGTRLVSILAELSVTQSFGQEIFLTALKRGYNGDFWEGKRNES